MSRRRYSSLAAIGSAWILAALLTPTPADEPIALRAEWTGTIGYVATGEPTAIDTNANDRVDTLSQPATVVVDPADVPVSATLVQAFLYWGGTIAQPTTACAAEELDDAVTFTPPAGPASAVAADVCYCADGGAVSYDMQYCRADVTSLVTAMTGVYALEEFTSKATDGATDNASFSVVLVFDDPLLPSRRVALHDGLVTVNFNSTSFSLGGLDAHPTPAGTLTYHTMEGDSASSALEFVSVNGSPGAAGPIKLSDAFNPEDNPMNRTINTQSTVVTDAVGVDIDRFDISGALSGGDTSLEVTYSTAGDKWWLGYQIVSVDLPPTSTCDPAIDVNQIVSCSTNLSDTTVGTSSVLVDYPCTSGLAQSNPEAIYAFSPQETGSVTVVIDDLTTDHDLYVLESACDTGACIASSTAASVTVDSVTFDASVGTTYYIVVEAFGGEGDFDLHFDVGFGGCREDCDNGLDDDSDSDVDCDDPNCVDDPPCCVDADTDGVCSAWDCDDTKSGCTTDCTDADGDGFCITTDCDDSLGSVFPGAPEVCDEHDNDCNDLVDDGIPAPSGSLALGVDRGQLIWTADPDATEYDVAQGLVSLLHQTDGDYSAAAQSCLADDEASTTTAIVGGPASGDAFWFLVRPANCGGSGSYGSASRDAGIGVCP